MTNHSHTSIDLLTLEQFATFIAALATDDATPLAILDNVLDTIAENYNATHYGVHINKEHILQQKATQIGYASLPTFRRDLAQMVRERLYDLRVTHLSAPERQLARALS